MAVSRIVSGVLAAAAIAVMSLGTANAAVKPPAGFALVAPSTAAGNGSTEGLVQLVQRRRGGFNRGVRRRFGRPSYQGRGLRPFRVVVIEPGVIGEADIGTVVIVRPPLAR